MIDIYERETNLFQAAFEKLVDLGKSVIVAGHIRPDGDCIGSTVALVRILNGLGVDAIGVNNDTIPENLKFIIGDTPFSLATELKNEDYICITVDSADYKRVGLKLNSMFPEVYLNIDHHISNKAYANKNIISSEASATAEILAGIFINSNYKIDTTTANALYVGIATDTGQFRFPSTNKNTFNIIGNLIDHGASPSRIAFELYENESYARIQLIQSFLSSLEIGLNGKVCIGRLTNQMYLNSGASTDDSDGLVDYARSIKGVEIGVLIEDRDGLIKGSLRAKDPKYRVDLIAQEFGGGGHACAAGFNISESSFESLKPVLLSNISKSLNSLSE